MAKREVIMRTQEEQEAWTLDQLAKSEFFHSKLHEWGMLNIAKQIDKAKGGIWSR